MDPTRRKLYSYIVVVAVYVIVLGWWMFFFAHQSDFLMRRMASSGVELPSDIEVALRNATNDSMRMFIFEGGFLGLLLLASVALVVRALQRELALHRQQRNFLSAVTHELKSPIASAKLYVESLRLGRAEGEKRERYLKHAHEDLDRLQQMVERLLETARMTTTGPELRLVALDLAQETRDIVRELALEPPCAAARVELSPSDPVPIRADAAALRTIFRNLLSNAVKYAGPEPHVSITVARRGARAVVTVCDSGPGLQGADPRRIFEAFVRGGDEIVRTTPGVGLGLFLVSELARAHGGAARALERSEGGGFGVEITLPLDREGS
jgi:signal transduction histidine kinase